MYFKAVRVVFSSRVGLSDQFGFGLLFDARVKFGLTGVNNCENVNISSIYDDISKAKNMSFCLMVGWRF